MIAAGINPGLWLMGPALFFLHHDPFRAQEMAFEKVEEDWNL